MGVNMIKLRDYQQLAHNESVKHCKESIEPAIHDQSVGAGKTLQIAFMVKHVADKGGSALVLARQGELIEQNVDDYFLIGGKASVFSASLKKRSAYYPVVYGTEGSVCRALKFEFKGKKFDFIALDECHELAHEEINDCISDAKKGIDFYNSIDTSGKKKYSQYAIILAHFSMVNPKVRIMGYSGSPFRGSESIVGGFWKKKLSEVGTYELVSKGYLVPPVFGWGSDDDHNYDLKKYSLSKDGNSGDFSSKELSAMQRDILKDDGKTKYIIEELVLRTENRLGVLITCAGKAHCREVAKYLPENTWAIVTDDVSTKNRREILKKAKSGEIKYVLQVNCLGQGVNVTRWDTIVILRKIGSLRYLIQLIGRGARTLKEDQVDEGLQKDDNLILDFTDTLECAGDIFDHPITDMAQAAKAKFSGTPIECPKCESLNSQFAVRCIADDKTSDDGRCEHFFKSSMCFGCMTQNAPTAKNCRKCGAVMIDPSLALRNKAYTDADYKPVLSMTLEKTKTNALRVIYALDSIYSKNGVEHQEFAREILQPFDQEQFKKAKWRKFITDHIQGNSFRTTIYRLRSIDEIIKAKAYFDAPTELTHRVNEKGFSIINRKKFRSGREALTG
jgi:DNA repair protein RadD